MNTRVPHSRPPHQLPVRAEAQRWLVTDLWLDDGVGLIGGEPKCYKSFLALDLAVSVAAGSPCLRQFPVPRHGRVLLYAELDLHVITAPTVRLDLPGDCDRLQQTIQQLKPRLLILDPSFV